MAFSLGLNIAQSSLSIRSFVISTIVFALASPLGIGIGIIISDLPPSLPGDICNGVLQGIKHAFFSIQQLRRKFITNFRPCWWDLPLHNVLRGAPP